MKKLASERSLRIIGGHWRSRKITFPDREGIRPTPDRVRETLFNWLATDIAGARCLELYAGSGVLSIEALSRGASHVTLVEKDKLTWLSLKENLLHLAGDKTRYRCIHDMAMHWLASNRETFNIVFLDPPFKSDELWPALTALLDTNALCDDGLVYLETPIPLPPSELPAPLVVRRQGKAGQVHYCLAAMRR